MAKTRATSGRDTATYNFGPAWFFERRLGHSVPGGPFTVFQWSIIGICVVCALVTSIFLSFFVAKPAIMSVVTVLIWAFTAYAGAVMWANRIDRHNEEMGKTQGEFVLDRIWYRFNKGKEWVNGRRYAATSTTTTLELSFGHKERRTDRRR